MKNIYYLFLALLFSSLTIQSCTNGSQSGANQPENADEVADAIQKAISKQDWDQTKWVHWIFPGPREHLWDRKRNFTEVKWGDYRAVINVNTQDGRIYQNDQQIDGPERDSLMQKAWSAHINDAFWLNGPANLFDDGTERSLVERDGKTCLKVEYTTGGVTPGDHYIWHYDENYLPTEWEMYVSVIPTPGVVSTWEKWITLGSGAKIATIHRTGDRVMEMKELKSGDSYQDFGRKEDPFGGL